MIDGSPNNEIWIAFIAAATGIIGALGIKDIFPKLFLWWEEGRKEKRLSRSRNEEHIQNLYRRIEKLEDDLDNRRSFEIKAKTAFNSMIPLMKEMMKDHPHYVKLLEQLEENIFGGEITPADGHKKEKNNI